MGRGSETQPQVVENLNKLTWQDGGLPTVVLLQRMQTSQADVYAAGDIVQFPLFLVDDELTTIEHWQMAHKHG